MNLERHFFELIRNNPEDDAPRLVYADWLDEQGDPRGEFIRVQCELARPNAPDRVPRILLQQREEELLKEFQSQWISSLSGFIVRDCRFERGFLTEAKLIDRVKSPLRERWNRLFESEPVLSNVELFLREDWEEIRTLGAVPQLRSLHLRHQRLERREVSWVLRSRVISSLKSLDLSHNFLRSGVECVARSASLDRLEELDLSFNRIGSRGARAITSSPFLRSITSLNLRGNHIGYGGKQRLRDIFGSRVQL